MLAALFDLPLPAKLRREALQLARDSLAVVEDQDVPLVVSLDPQGHGVTCQAIERADSSCVHVCVAGEDDPQDAG